MEGYQRFEESLTDIIKEQQAKLGYRKEFIRLYYPLSTLNHFFEAGDTQEEMCERLKNLPKSLTGRLGKLQITCKNERFCIEIPDQGSEYVHEHMEENEFIGQLISLVGQHGCTRESIIDLFRGFWQDIEIQDMDNGEFDFYVKFNHYEKDKYYYCFKDEGCHMIYHRFLPEDYKDFHFGE